MSFYIFTSGTTAYANEVMDNFYHVADGDRLPLGGQSLTSTDSAYDIGSSSTTWSNAFINTINCTNLEITGSVTSTKTWNIMAYSELDDTATAIEFTGLSGDIDKEYFIQMNVYPTESITTYTYVIFNGDSATNYCIQTNIHRLTLTSIRLVNSNLNSYSVPSFFNVNVYARSGGVRGVLANRTMPTSGNPEVYTIFYGGVWNNTDDEITSIKFYINTGSFGTNTSIYLWAKC